MYKKDKTKGILSFKIENKFMKSNNTENSNIDVAVGKVVSGGMAN